MSEAAQIAELHMRVDFLMEVICMIADVGEMPWPEQDEWGQETDEEKEKLEERFQNWKEHIKNA